MEQHAVPVRRVINGGGIPRRSRVLNQIYADVLNKPILVPARDVTGLGSAIFAFIAAGTIEEAQTSLCPKYEVFEPRNPCRAVYEDLFGHYQQLYFAFGQKDSDQWRLDTFFLL